MLIGLSKRKYILNILRYLRDTPPSYNVDDKGIVKIPKNKFSNTALKDLRDIGFIKSTTGSRRYTLEEIGTEALKLFDDWTLDDFKILGSRVVQRFCWAVIQAIEPYDAIEYFNTKEKVLLEPLYSKGKLTKLGQNYKTRLEQISTFIVKRLPNIFQERSPRFPEYNREYLLLKYLQMLYPNIIERIEKGEDRKQVQEAEGDYEWHCEKLLIPRTKFHNLMRRFALESLVSIEKPKKTKKYFVLNPPIDNV